MSRIGRGLWSREKTPGTRRTEPVVVIVVVAVVWLGDVWGRFQLRAVQCWIGLFSGERRKQTSGFRLWTARFEAS